MEPEKVAWFTCRSRENSFTSIKDRANKGGGAQNDLQMYNQYPNIKKEKLRL